MTHFWPVVRSEWRLQWRSPAPWLAALVTICYCAYPAYHGGTFLGMTIRAAGMFTGIYAFAISLSWVAAGGRTCTYVTQELVHSCSLPAELRMVAELTGSLLLGMALMLPIVGIEIALVLAGAPAEPGMARDLLLLGPLAVPNLLAWLVLSRAAARYLPAAPGYLAMLVLWAIGIWWNGVYTLSYLPGAKLMSELTFFGTAPNRLLIEQRLILLAAAFLGGLWLIWPRTISARGAMRAPAAWLLVGALTASLAMPGFLLLRSDGTDATSAPHWAALAQKSPRWGSLQVGEARLYLAPAHRSFAEPILWALDQLAALDGSVLPADIEVIEAPVDHMVLDGQRLLLPEQVLAGAATPEMVQRRMVSRWVQLIADVPVAAAERRNERVNGIVEMKDGARLFLEWRYAETVVGPELTEREIAAWAFLGRRLGVSQALTDGLTSPSTVTQLPVSSDLSGLARWRGGEPGSGTPGLEMAFALHERLADAPLQAIRASFPRWERLLHTRSAAPGATRQAVEELLQLVDDQL